MVQSDGVGEGRLEGEEGGLGSVSPGEGGAIRDEGGKGESEVGGVGDELAVKVGEAKE